jgi:hypothetical protein
MTQESMPTRRSFLKGGALLTAPIALASVSAAALADEELNTRLMRLEDEAAIRELHQSWLRQVNAGGHPTLHDSAVRRITAHHAGAPDRIEVAADGASAFGYFDCVVQSETSLAEDCTLAQMAHAQGHGTVPQTERRILTIEFTKASGTWRIGKVTSETNSR